MAERRMFAKTIIDSDSFLDMPLSTQALYFHIVLHTEDNFEVRSPKALARSVSASQEDLETLYQNNYLEIIEGSTFIHTNGRPYSIQKRPNWNEWKEIRKAVFRRDGYVCQYCGIKVKKPECDHIIPISKGGDSSFKNLTTSCIKCNREKGNKIL